MGKETKSNGRKDSLDRFYTSSETVDKCLECIDLNEYDCIIEPSAGNGSFLAKLPDNCYSYDISPEHEKICQQDWFLLDKNIFQKYENILVIGNPPFGQQNNLAIRFFNESAKFADTIAFLLPLSFKKYSVQNKLDLSFHLAYEMILKDTYFTIYNSNENYKVPCVFQVWKRKAKEREIVKYPLYSNIFSFVKREDADFRVQRVGGKAGIATFDIDNVSSNSNYFIKNTSSYTSQQLVDIINNISFPSVEFTVGPKSLPKGELIYYLEKSIEQLK